MKKIYLSAFMMIIISAFGYAAFAADYCCPDPDTGDPCLNCRAPAYDNTPVAVTVPCPESPGYIIRQVSPQQICGTFCEAGQVAAGWPYGWRSEYWLRPDSNF